MGLWLAGCATAMATVLGVGAEDGRVEFHNTASLHAFDGQARRYAGQLDTAALVGDLTVEAASLSTGLGPRDSRLLSWCLEAVRFPSIHLAVARITGAVEGLQRAAGTGGLTLQGTLTIRDVVRDVAIPATYAWEGPNLRLKGRYDMKWTDWNLPDPSTVLSTVAPEMDVTFDVLAKPS
jgi:polyisoprenoid-binding protein YceI